MDLGRCQSTSWSLGVQPAVPTRGSSCEWPLATSVPEWSSLMMVSVVNYPYGWVSFVKHQPISNARLQGQPLADHLKSSGQVQQWSSSVSEQTALNKRSRSNWSFANPCLGGKVERWPSRMTTTTTSTCNENVKRFSKTRLYSSIKYKCFSHHSFNSKKMFKTIDEVEWRIAENGLKYKG